MRCRRHRDAYQIWVSEVMLQQTQVAAVEAYFDRFIDRFPTVAALAAAPEEEVLRQWEGLGYYRRARQMHAAAKQIVDQHGGRLPRDSATLQQLPGVGRYTAGAVLSIAHDAREPILEANSIRVLSRLIGYRDDPRRAAGQRTLWSLAAAVLPRKQVGRFNQALMELGSGVCSIKSPDCPACPARSLCAAFSQGLQQSIPAAGKRMQYTDLEEAAVVLRSGSKILLRRCGEDERWAGLWDFPRFEIDTTQSNPIERQIAAQLAELAGDIELGRQLATIKHGVTRFRITLHCYEATTPSPAPPPGAGSGNGASWKWTRPASLEQLPLSTTGRRIARLIAQ